MRLFLRFTTAALLFSLVPASGAWASSQMLADAKKSGMPAKNCQYCHTEAMPKKDSFKPEALNDRGKFLITDKDTRKLKAVDIQKLKDFPGGKEQK